MIPRSIGVHGQIVQGHVVGMADLVEAQRGVDGSPLALGAQCLVHRLLRDLQTHARLPGDPLGETKRELCELLTVDHVVDHAELTSLLGADRITGEERQHAVAEEIRAGGETATAFAHDITSEVSNDELVDRTVAEYGRIDVLVNNAALYGRLLVNEQEDVTTLGQDSSPCSPRQFHATDLLA
jgi:hypothetical protein